MLQTYIYVRLRELAWLKCRLAKNEQEYQVDYDTHMCVCVCMYKNQLFCGKEQD